MRYPKLKNPILCRILSYVVVIGSALIPIIIVFNLPIPDPIKVLFIVGALIGLLFYLIKNFMVLMSMDVTLALLSCNKTARTQYTLPPHRSPEAIRRSIMRYGTNCEPTPIKPQPSALRYRFSSPITVYSRGIERVVAAYEVDQLDNELYREIFRSAQANSNALKGRRKALFLEPAQKKQPLHRVTVILILAHKVDPRMTAELYKLVCRQCGDEEENCFLPCVVDLEHRTCVFNCVRVPYIGFSYAVKNRGIRIIKHQVFCGNLNLAGNNHKILDEHKVLYDHDLDTEYTLWDLWRSLRHEFIDAEKETKRRFESMDEKQLRIFDEILYLKWDHRGICQIVQTDEDNNLVKVQTVTDWAYPKSQPVGKKTIQALQQHITAYYAGLGYTVEFIEEIFE